MAEPEVILRIDDLRVSYGRVQAVDDLNLTVRAGEIYGFLGRNGAGKTTTIRAMMGIIKPNGGRIELLGYRGRRIRVKQKQRIGYVSQEQHFYPWMSCRALGRFVSGFYPTWDHGEFDRLLQLLDLPPRRRVSHLSGGMRVKLALALALAHRPPILILDEPTSGLDPVTRREFLEIISRQARTHNRTTFFSSHLIDEVERVADRVGIIHNGRLCYEGEVTTLQESVREVSHVRSNGAALPTAEQTEYGEAVPLETVEAGAANSDSPVLAESVDETAAAAAFPPDVLASDTARRGFQETAEARGFVVLRDGFGDGPSSVVFGAPASMAGPSVRGSGSAAIVAGRHLHLHDRRGDAEPMTVALIVKELREHWLPLLLIAGIMAVGFLLILAGVMLDDSGSRLEAVRRFLIALLPLGVLVLCNRLVVREYQSKTQLFLESLPVSRGRMIAVKYLLGLALVFLAVSLVFALAILVSLRSETLTGRFVGIVSARVYTFSWCLYSFFFLMGLMGRYRVAIYVFGILGLFALDALTQVELARFGPFVLVDDQFAFERVVFPRQALLVSLASGSVLVLLTLVLSLIREGTVATLLAEKMSHREKITVAGRDLRVSVFRQPLRKARREGAVRSAERGRRPAG